MAERHIEPMDAYEKRLSGELRALSARAVRTIDPVLTTRQLALAHPLRVGRGANLREWLAVAAGRPVGVPLLAVLGLLVLVMLAAALLVAGRPDPLPTRLGHLAYVLGTDVFVADWDGRGAVRITDRAADGQAYSDPRWYGTALSYRSGVGGPDDPTLLVEGPNGAVREIGRDSLVGATRSPDGRLFARINGATLEIGSPGGPSTILRPPPGYPVWDGSGLGSLSWSPDGSAILAGACTTDPCSDQATGFDQTANLFLVPTDGGAPLRLSDHEAPAWNAAYSPDGSRILFVACHRATGGPMGCDPSGYYLGVMRADGTGRQVIVGSPSPGDWTFDLTYAWSPDGRQIAYSYGTWDAGPLGIWVVDTDLRDPPRKLEAPATKVLGWSPDGRLVLGGSFVDATDHGLWAVSVEARSSTKLVTDATDGAWEWVVGGATDPFASPRR